MRIVHVVNDMDLGGVQIISTQKLIDLGKLGHSVAMTTYRDGYASKFLREEGIHIEVCKDRPDVVRFLRDFGAEIVHGHSCGGGSEGVEAGREAGIPAGETIHSMVPGQRVAQFEVVHTEMCHSIRPDSKLIYWGFNTERLSPVVSREAYREMWGIPQNAYVIARNSRLDGSKSPVDFIIALSKLPGVWGLIGGWGPEADRLQRMASSLQIMDRLVFTGAQFAVGDIFNAADAIVYPTSDESFCAGVVEPMYLKKPVTCYLRGGMGQHVIDKETALVAENPDQLASNVASFIYDPELAKIIGENGYKRCEELGYWNSIEDARQHIEVYKEAINIG